MLNNSQSTNHSWEPARSHIYYSVSSIRANQTDMQLHRRGRVVGRSGGRAVGRSGDRAVGRSGGRSGGRAVGRSGHGEKHFGGRNGILFLENESKKNESKHNYLFS